jgi:hypothetical protein
MPKERWASRAIVNMLIDEKNFKAAAEVVSGCRGVFGNSQRSIQAAMAALDQEQSLENKNALQEALGTAEDEIKQFREWESNVKQKLGHTAISAGAVLPLWKQFEEASAGANFLDALVTGTRAKYFS